MKNEARYPKHRFHGRRKGKSLTNYRQSLVDGVLPDYAIDIKKPLAGLGDKDEVWLEIGFGNGEFLSHSCQDCPDTGFIGCEPFINGIAALLASLQTSVSNLKIWNDDARLLIDALPDACIDRIYLLNPDPWPKTRHHKRRYVQPETLDEFARIMKPGAQLTMSSDHLELAEWMFYHTDAHDAFVFMEGTDSSWLNPPADWPIEKTRYMKKGLAGTDIHWLCFQRK